jgi:hypothetical protein
MNNHSTLTATNTAIKAAIPAISDKMAAMFSCYLYVLIVHTAGVKNQTN